MRKGKYLTILFSGFGEVRGKSSERKFPTHMLDDDVTLEAVLKFSLLQFLPNIPAFCFPRSLKVLPTVLNNGNAPKMPNAPSWGKMAHAYGPPLVQS